MNRELEILLKEIEENAIEYARAGQFEFSVELSDYCQRIRCIFNNTGLMLLNSVEPAKQSFS